MSDVPRRSEFGAARFGARLAVAKSSSKVRWRVGWPSCLALGTLQPKDTPLDQSGHGAGLERWKQRPEFSVHFTPSLRALRVSLDCPPLAANTHEGNALCTPHALKDGFHLRSEGWSLVRRLHGSHSASACLSTAKAAGRVWSTATGYERPETSAPGCARKARRPCA
jgi:hypothetical protein